MKRYKTLVDISNMIGNPVIKRGSVFMETKNGYELEKIYNYNGLGFGYDDKSFVENNNEIFKEINEKL